jgi:hypothetical protein
MAAEHERDPDRDADALSWAGDSDPTLVPGETGVPELPDGWSIPGQSTARASEGASAGAPRSASGAGDTTTGAGDSAAGRSSAPGRSGRASAAGSPAGSAAGSAALVGMGVLAGIYLLYTVGWFIGVSRIGNPLVDPVGEFMFSLGAWLAVAAPLVWFGTTYWLTGGHGRARGAWLVLGAVLLAPLPLLFGAGGVS